ncbi:MAG TPA: WecB/TagA/CpsF family glycosyltransferase [Ignavibacteria bacterium]|nr:WecB/TagA/CpsF family glycosyltransferase [Ignavibacteria bacterium]HMR39826.1 WecB/TagA/CpsF family glycosyltransferase [Ignavibacteria bacterium]
MSERSIKIFGIRISKLSDSSFLEYIKSGIEKNRKIIIGYANADTLNKIYDNKELRDIYESFDLIHPDGVGVYSASRILLGNDGLESRLTGSDFYPFLIDESIKNNWKIFFFGHSDKILGSIQKKHPLLKIAGMNEGYNFDDEKVIEKINIADPDILIMGLSCPKQEIWIYNNKDKINFRVALNVGDGIKVFAGKKVRGPVILRKAGLEWFSRLISEPSNNFSKYVAGIPLFIYRIMKEKLNN